MTTGLNEKDKILELVRSGLITPQEAASKLRKLSKDEHREQKAVKKSNNVDKKQEVQGFAVVGISGRFPGARNVNEFWSNLVEGIDSVTEIPGERWDVKKYYSPVKNVENKTSCKWGGILDDVDKFDAEFFNISAKEALLMDPQQRLVLQESWKALEDAGYSQKLLEQLKVGVFIGATYGDYVRRISETKDAWEIYTLTGNQISMLAARISYFLNLTGPNLTIDTACSSSLVAISTACQNLQNHECDMAIAGGVHVLTTPEMYVMTSRGGMLSSTGKCHAFDNSADGFVPGEGVGIVVLKRYDDALREGDHIYGVIRGAKVNQDGKTNGITAPSIKSQHDLECSVYDQYQIDPNSITYIETHGTGTKLGDPIEFTALKKSFEKYTDDKNYCGLGAVKANIGHGMISSGVASFIKVMLCLKNKKLVPLANFSQINEMIDIENSPFYVCTEYKDWDKKDCYPRRAAISSFGLSGTNCHMVVEEAEEQEIVRTEREYSKYLLLFSGNSVSSLKTVCRNIRNYVQENEVSMRDLAYTLSAGRTALAVRTFVIAKDINDLMSQLNEMLSGEFVYRDNRDDCFMEDTVRQEAIEKLLNAIGNQAHYDEVLQKLADAYMDSYQVDYYKMLQPLCPRRISIPTYPFEENRFWVEFADKNEQTLMDTIKFSGDEVFLKGHIVQGKKVLPGVMYLNLVKTYYEKHYSKEPIELRDVVWIKPFVYTDNNHTIYLNWKKENEYISCEISSVGLDGERYIHSKCKIYVCKGETNTVRIKELLAACKQKESAEDIYQLIEQKGILYDNGFKVLKSISCNDSRCVAYYSLNSGAVLSDFRLHPMIMDGALQTVITFSDRGKKNSYLPYMIQSIQIRSELTEKGYFVSHVREDGTNKTFDIQIVDENGNVLISINQYIPRILRQEKEEALKANVAYIERTWLKQEKDIYCDVNLENVLMIDNEDLIVDSEILSGFMNKFGGKRDSYVQVVLDDSQNGQKGKRMLQSFWNVLGFLKEYFQQRSGIPCRVLYLANSSNLEQVAIEGLAKSIELEQPNMKCKVIVTDHTFSRSEIIKREFSGPFDTVMVRYCNKERSIAKFQEVSNMGYFDSYEWKEEGAYIVSGGAGGIGLHIVEYLVSKHKVHFILLGRKLLSDSLQKKLEKMNLMLGSVEYCQCDVSNKDDVYLKMNGFRTHYKKINGVIHSAGVVNDAYFIKKTDTQILQTFAPKINGINNLDEATAQDKLDFFVAFSSIGALTGNIGQCDYTYANSYMDSFIAERNSKCHSGNRSGKSISYNWPLWRNGGMNVDAKTLEILHKKLGMVPMETEEGIKTFLDGLSSSSQQIISMCGQKEVLIRHLNKESKQKKEKEEQTMLVDDNSLFEKTQDFLRKIVASVLEIQPEELYPKRSFEYYGIESILIVSLNEELEKYFGDLSKTLFFEYQNLNALTDYFVKNQRDKLVELFGLQKKELSDTDYEQKEMSQVILKEDRKEKDVENGIAIIGINGKYPMADHCDEFWENLKKGKDCIEEIPSARWDYHARYDKDSSKKGTYNSKFGGFIGGVDQFDSLFFEISPREAEMIDPQERLFLESSWATFQEAGYSKKALAAYKVGVFAAAMYSHYQMFGVEETMKGNPMGLHSTLSSIANRVSYSFNLHGPSMTVDTMCSSSLTAIHLACQSIRTGECDMALAGGVNLSLHENKYILLGQGKFLSNDGRCRSFGADGNGYVPGEGVGTILLKTLDRAIEDGDHIYGVIKSTVVNHGGRTSGYTVPSLVEQARMEKEVVQKAKIDVNQIGYIEAHGTGTSLGDPIEINALTKSIGDRLVSGRRIPIGSVKSNIGHLEAASGIAAITKVIYMMKYGQLVPSLHSDTLNPNIDFDNVPFYVQQKLEDWKRPVIEGVVKPRIAIINSFGAGGSNAGIVLEEYVQDRKIQIVEEKEFLLILSSKKEKSLRDYAKNVAIFLKNKKYHMNDCNVGDVNDFVKKLQKMIARVYEVYEEEIDCTMKLADLLIDPMEGIHVCNLIEDEFGIQLSVNRLREFESVYNLADYLVNQSGQSMDDRILLSRVAYTLQIGRDEYNYRLAIVARSVDDAINKLSMFAEGKCGNDVSYKHLKRLKSEEINDATEERMVYRAITDRNYRELADLWIEGYEIDFRAIYKGTKIVKMTMPVPCLERIKCWYDSYQSVSEDGNRQNTAEDLSNAEETVSVKKEISSEAIRQEKLRMIMEKEAFHYTGNEVTLEVLEGKIALVKMQDVENRNTFTKNVIHGLMAKFHEIKQMGTIKAIIVTGNENVFCMGGTKEQLNSIQREENAFTDVPFLYRGLLSTDVPVISAMQGHAFGGGMLFGLYADIVIMSRDSLYSAVFTKYGFTPGMGATYILREKMGNSLSNEMMYTANVYTGAELERRGANVMFANQEEVLNRAMFVARQIADKPKYTLEVLKRGLADRVLRQLKNYIEEEERMHKLSFSNPEVEERIKHYYINAEKKNEPKVSEKEKESRKLVPAKTKIAENHGGNQGLYKQIILAVQNHKITPEQAKKLYETCKNREV